MNYLVERTAGFAVMVNGWLSFGGFVRKNPEMRGETIRKMRETRAPQRATLLRRAAEESEIGRESSP